MQHFARDYGHQLADGSYELQTTFLSVSASIIYVGEFFGAILAAPINDRFGRKAVFACASVCIIAGAVVQVCSFSIDGVFYLGRILVGLGIGQFTATCLIYIADVAPGAIRGPALMMFQFMQSIAQFIGACVNQGTEGIDGTASYQVPMGLLCVLPLIMLVLLPFTPESPAWFMTQGKRDQAKYALVKINRSTTAYDPEFDLNVIDDQVRLDQELEAESIWTSLIRDPIERRKLFFACGAMFSQQICGIQFWYTYGVVFAQSIGVGEPFTINTIIYVVQIITVGCSVVLGNKVPRRANLLVCTLGSIISLVIVGGLGTTRDGDSFSRVVGILIVVFAFFNIIFYNFSIGTLSYTIASEMALGRNRNKITACAISVFFFTVWVMVFTSPYLYYDAALGPMLGFVYAGTSLVLLAYSWFCVGETTGRSNAELERFFADGIPVRSWGTHVWDDATTFSDVELKKPEKASEVEGSDLTTSQRKNLLCIHSLLLYSVAFNDLSWRPDVAVGGGAGTGGVDTAKKQCTDHRRIPRLLHNFLPLLLGRLIPPRRAITITITQSHCITLASEGALLSYSIHNNESIMSSFGKVYSYTDNPRTLAILAVAKANNLNIELVETIPGNGLSEDYLKLNKLGRIPTFEGADGYTLTECIAIAVYTYRHPLVTSQNEKTTLLGKTKQDYASILKWMSFANSELLPGLGGWFRPLIGRDPYNKKNVDDAQKATLANAKILEEHFLVNTYLVGERLTLADLFTVAMISRGFQYFFDKQWRDEHPSLTRWYETVYNQDIYSAVAPKFAFTEKALPNTAPKKEEKPKAEPPKKQEKKAAPKEVEDEEEEDKPAPKPKHPLDSLPKATFVLDDWKRKYSNEETREVALPWFWENVKFDEYSIWKVDYKYNDELTMTFMTSNLIGGFFARLEGSRKYIFGAASVYGVTNDSVVQGAFVIRGQEALPAFDVAPDYESYSFTKLDPTKAEDKEFVNDQWAWDKPIEVAGKKYEWADGKVFK
nr:elongation factor 1-gamma 1 [Quercus suber]